MRGRRPPRDDLVGFPTVTSCGQGYTPVGASQGYPKMVMRSSNRLIRGLSPAARAKFQERATRLRVARGEVLQQAAFDVEYVIFP